MAVLVTRPHPDDETTAASLRARGFEVLRAPMLRFEPVAVHEDMNARYSAVIVTSANALRGIEPHLKGHRMLELPLFAVGEHTAAAARRAGFTHVVSANADAANLRYLVLASLRAKELKKASTLLYLAGAELSRDLASELVTIDRIPVAEQIFRSRLIGKSVDHLTCRPRAVGWVVTLIWTSWRRSWRRTRKARSRRKVRVGTTKKSTAAISRRWASRKVRQVGEGRGERRRMYLAIVSSATS